MNKEEAVSTFETASFETASLRNQDRRIIFFCQSFWTHRYLFRFRNLRRTFVLHHWHHYFDCFIFCRQFNKK